MSLLKGFLVHEASQPLNFVAPEAAHVKILHQQVIIVKLYDYPNPQN